MNPQTKAQGEFCVTIYSLRALIIDALGDLEFNTENGAATQTHACIQEAYDALTDALQFEQEGR